MVLYFQLASQGYFYANNESAQNTHCLWQEAEVKWQELELLPRCPLLAWEGVLCYPYRSGIGRGLLISGPRVLKKQPPIFTFWILHFNFVTSPTFKREKKRYAIKTVTGKPVSLLSTSDSHCGKTGLFAWTVRSPPPGVQAWILWHLCWDGV